MKLHTDRHIGVTIIIYMSSTDKNYDFYSYGQIIRNQIPEGLTDFYILHEGPIATLDEELIGVFSVTILCRLHKIVT